MPDFKRACIILDTENKKQTDVYEASKENIANIEKEVKNQYSKVKGRYNLEYGFAPNPLSVFNVDNYKF